MNILLINHYAGSPVHGMEFRPYYLAREWVRMGHNVKIVAGAYSHIRAKQPEVPPNATHMDETLDGINYRWYKTSSYEGNGLGRVLSMLSFLKYLWKDSTDLIKNFKPEMVIASSTYPMDIWPAHHIAKKSGAKLVYEVHDLWPLSPMELGGMSKWHPFIMWVQMAEDYAYRHADKVVSMLPKAQAYMESRGMNPAKFAYVPNGVDEDEWSLSEALPVDVEQRLLTIRACEKPIIGYAGTHGLANALDDLLDTAKNLQSTVEVVLVGTGPERERLMGRLKKEKITNVHMLNAIPKKSIPSLLSYFDIAYIGWHLNPLYKFGISPNKLMDYMMAGRPIIHAVSAGNDPVAEAGCGITVKSGDVNAISHAVIHLLKLTPQERDEMGKNGKRFILHNQTYEKLAKKFLISIN